MKNSSKGCHSQKISKIPESESGKMKENKERKPNCQPQIRETNTGSIAP